MLSISKPLSSGQAQTYHKMEFTAADQSYYRQGGAVEGEWQGRLAESFGLAGQPVEARQFALLTEGKNPQTEEQIIRSKPSKEYTNPSGTKVKPVEHRAGWDATFSAPKSVSLAALVGGDERVREAHREAVTAALGELERYTQARIGGNNPAETTGRFLAAKFEHDTARPVDGYAAPQLHTHAVIFNMTQRDDGTMRALQSKSYFDSRSYATAVYQSELTVRLRDLGYELTAGKSGAPEIKGFTQEYLDASSPRSQQIREQMEKSGFQSPAAAQIAALETRNSKQTFTPEEVLAAHRRVAEEYGNQPRRVVDEARERSRKEELAPGRTPDHRAAARAAVAYAKEHVYEREAVADRRTILRDALRRGMGETTPAEVQAEFDRRREAGEFRQAGNRLYDTDRRYTTPETLAAERAVIGIVRSGQNTVEPMMTTEKAEKEAAAKSFLNPTQRAVIEEVMTSRDRIHGLQGLAGTGKTTLDSIRQGAEKAGYTVEGFAPTSKATGQLREAGIEADTLQGFLVRKEEEGPKQKHFYMLDESSLASSRQMRDFLRKLGPDDRVLVIGDTGQHEGVDAGRPFAQMQQAGMRTAQLSEIMRQKDPELRRAVEHLAKGETAEGVKLLGEQGRITEIKDAQERIAAIAKDYMAKPESTIIVSPDNASRRELNQAVRTGMLKSGKLKGDGREFQTLIPRGDLTGADRAWAARYAEGDVVRYARGSKTLGIERGSYAVVSGVNAAQNEMTVRREDGQVVTYDPTRLRGVSVYRELGREFATGDRLQFTAPDKKLEIANRDLGTVTEVKADRLTVKLDGKNGRSISFDPRQMRHIDHAYAVTSHSSQGLTVDRVLVNIDSAVNKLLINTRLAYVAVSRAAHDARIYVSQAEGLEKQLGSQITKTAAIEFGPLRDSDPSTAVGPKRQTVAPEAPDPTAAMRHAARMLGTDEARTGVNVLETQGRVTVEPDRAARLTRMVEDYANRREGTVAVVRTPGERDELNRLIRAELQRSRAISPDSRELPVLVERAIAPKSAAGYKPGDVIEFRAGSAERGIEPNSSARVLAVDAERNRLTIQTRDGEAKTYNPAKLKVTKQSRVYTEQTRQIALGERIRINAGSRPEGIRAGDFATVEAIRGIGALQVRTDAGKVVELNPALSQHIEYGYAAEGSKPVRAERLLVGVESPTQLERNSSTLKAVLASKDTRFYTPERSTFYEAKMPKEIEKMLARTAPLQSTVGQAEAQNFRWIAETGTIQTYRHNETGRNLHIDAATGQFFDQNRVPISQAEALNHAGHGSQTHEHRLSMAAIERGQTQEHGQGLSL